GRDRIADPRRRGQPPSDRVHAGLRAGARRVVVLRARGGAADDGSRRLSGGGGLSGCVYAASPVCAQKSSSRSGCARRGGSFLRWKKSHMILLATAQSSP